MVPASIRVEWVHALLCILFCFTLPEDTTRNMHAHSVCSVCSQSALVDIALCAWKGRCEVQLNLCEAYLHLLGSCWIHCFFCR